MSRFSLKYGCRSALALFAVLSLSSSCLQSTGVTSKSSSSLSTGQANCALPNAKAVANVAQRFAASAEEIGPDFCGKSENYECYVRKFSPDLVDGKSVVEECGHVPELGGNLCLKMNANFFNTREASRAPGTAAAASLVGGEFNRSEYVCHNRELKDADVFLAVGEGDALGEALSASYAKCAAVAPRLAVGK
jgi:hypothetical protein